MKVWKFNYSFISGYPTRGIEPLAQAETFEDALQIFKNRLKELNQQNTITVASLELIGDATGLQEVEK